MFLLEHDDPYRHIFPLVLPVESSVEKQGFDPGPASQSPDLHTLP